MGFDIMNLQKGRGTVQARNRADEGRAVLKYIDVDDLVPSEDNFYSMSAIEDLASLIELSGGVKQPALVSPLGGGKYKVIAGHRRRLASLQLVKQGKEAYRKMPCMVEDGERETGPEADELRAIDEAILLITTNGQREKTDWDKVQEATRLRELLNRKRQFEKIPGETRKLIAEQLGTTPAQVGRYDSIAKHLIPEFKTWLAEGKIGISVAYELSMLPEDAQRYAAAEFEVVGGPVTLEDVRRWRSAAERKAAKQPPTAGERDEPEAAEGAPKYGPGEYVREETPRSQVAPSPAQEPPAKTDAGKVVDSPASSEPPLVPPVDDGQGGKKFEWAALMLRDLRNYCETMAAVKGDRTVPWTDYADALDVVISAMRK